MSKIDCNCSDYNERESTKYYEDGRLVEVVYRCINCNEITSVWSYGQWFDVSDDE